MRWDPRAVLTNFSKVAQLAGVSLTASDICIEELPAPHKPPTHLPDGQMAVYVFVLKGDVLKVGKVGPKSNARYTSQHYNPRGAKSTLAASMAKDSRRLGMSDAECAEIGSWIRANVDRVNFLIPAERDIPVLTLLESYLQCLLRPRYEGFPSQRG